MGKFQSISIFGGEEVFSKYSTFKNTGFNSFLEAINKINEGKEYLHNAVNYFIKTNKFIKIDNFLSKSLLKEFKYKNIQNIHAFIKKKILFYPGFIIKSDFLLDLLILGYFYSIRLFEIGLIFPDNNPRGKYEINSKTIIQMINDPAFCLPKFPAIYYINK